MLKKVCDQITIEENPTFEGEEKVKNKEIQLVKLDKKKGINLKGEEKSELLFWVRER